MILRSPSPLSVRCVARSVTCACERRCRAPRARARDRPRPARTEDVLRSDRASHMRYA